MQTLILNTSETFRFSSCLWYLHQWCDHECLHRIEGKSLRKAVRLHEKPIYFEISEQAPSQLTVNYVTSGGPGASGEHLREYIMALFDLNTDLLPFYQLGEQDELLEPVIQKLYGLRIVGIPDLFEALCWAIIGQQINLTFAYTLKRRFVETFGHRIEHEGQLYFIFPSSALVAQLSVSDLTALQFSARKAAYIIGIAKAITHQELTKAQLQTLSLEQAKEQLVQWKGIGNWTANYVLMKSLQMRDAFPIEDVGLHNALKKLMKLSQKPTLPAIEQWAKPWSGWRAYLTFYLWQTLLDHE